MKTLKHKSIMGIIYGVLLLMPFLSIFSRVIYVQSNKNAYQSYSETSTMTTTLISENAQSIVGNNYMINLIEGSGYSSNIYVNSSTIDYDYIAGTELSYDVVGFRFFPNNTHFRLIDSNNLTYNYELNDEKRNYLNGQTFNWKSGNLVETNSPVRFYMVSYTSGKLDNVFEYSVSQFINDNNFGKVNLFNWFTDLFLANNAHNNMYVHFINWYLNYSMLVSCMHLLFLVLMWFVNYSKRLLDRGMNYDW